MHSEKKRSGGYIIPVIMAAILMLAIAAFSQWGVKNYGTREQYINAGGIIPYEIPENAADIRYAIYKSALRKSYFYSFEMDKDSFEEYLAQIAKQRQLNEKWYGKKVSECFDPDYELDDFPVRLHFEAVIDCPIESCEVILYDPFGTGTISSGMVVDKDTYRVVVYECKNIR